MAEYSRMQDSFSSGVIDGALQGQFSSQLYASGLKKCHNYIPSSRGYLFRRPGSRYVGFSVDAASCRMHIIRSADGPLIVIIKQGEIFFYNEQNNLYFSITDGSDIPFSSERNSIPWSSADLAQLDIAEATDALYVVHPDYPPCMIKGIGVGITAPTIDDSQTVEASYEADTSMAVGTYDLEEAIAQGLWSCTEVKFIQNSGVEQFDSAGHYPACQVFKGGRWYLAGCRDLPTRIFASRAPDAYGNFRFNDFYMGSYHLIKTVASMSKITIYTSITHAEIASVSYTTEAETEITDIPITVSDYEEPTAPEAETTVRYYDAQGQETSESGAYIRMVETTVATSYSLKVEVSEDDAIELIETGMYGSQVKWLASQQRVLAGTRKSIWMDTGAAATPASFDMVQTLGVGCSNVPPIMWSSMMIFVPADMRSVKGFYYNSDSGGYQLVDLSAGARDIFVSDVKKICIVEGQETLLWVLLDDGSLLSCTLGGEVFGWATHSIAGGTVTDIFPYQSDRGEGSLFLAMKRSASDRQYIETITLENIRNSSSFLLLDGAFSHMTEGDYDRNCFSHGDELQVLLDDGSCQDYAFKSSLDFADDYISGSFQQVGFQIVAEVQMLWQELPSNSQTSLGNRRRVKDVIVKVYRSAGGEIGYITDGSEHMKRTRSSDGAVLLQGAETEITENFSVSLSHGDLYSGLVRLPLPSCTSDIVSTIIRASRPVPLTLLAVETRYIIMEA